jgi:hypothetical protein
MQRSPVLLALAVTIAVTLAAAPRVAHAKKKAKATTAACGLKFLPFVEGTEWTYEFAVADSPGADPEAAKGVLKLHIPPKLVIKVVKVERSGDRAAITLEETFRKVTLTTKVTCDADSVEVDPSSFLASGEPGGGLGMEISSFRRGESPTYVHRNGSLQDGESWREDVTFDATRPPQGSDAVHAPAKVEIERLAKVSGREQVGDYPNALKLDLQLTGRAWVVDKEKSVNMPPAQAALWFESNVGLVRAVNAAGHAWQLSGVTQPQAPAN